VREARDDGSAVLLSSHVLREVESVADRVVLLRRGRVVAAATLADLREHAPHQVDVVTDDDAVAPTLAALTGIAAVSVVGRHVRCTSTSAALGDVLQVLAAAHVRDVRIEPADLEQLFGHYYEGTP
jgi:ABC-2 type transport system ATP-binding protein